MPADQIALNRSHWEARAEVHLASTYYNLAVILEHGPQPIFGPDEEEVGPVVGKSLLHLMCHLGTDSLRWATLGAQVTGVDFSPASIRAARGLATRLDVTARFIESDVYDLPCYHEEQFDIVYASAGVICWLPNLDAWARVAAGFVRPSGFLYLSEGHPFGVASDPARFGRGGYFDRGPRRHHDDLSYTDGGQIAQPANVRWSHTMGDVVSAIAAAGLRLDFLHEHPWCPRQRDPNMIADEKGRWRLPGDPVPEGFTIKASKLVD